MAWSLPSPFTSVLVCVAKVCGQRWSWVKLNAAMQERGSHHESHVLHPELSVCFASGVQSDAPQSAWLAYRAKMRTLHRAQNGRYFHVERLVQILKHFNFHNLVPGLQPARCAAGILTLLLSARNTKSEASFFSLEAARKPGTYASTACQSTRS